MTVVVTAEVASCAHHLINTAVEDLSAEETEAETRARAYVQVDAPDGHMIVATYARHPVNVLPGPWPADWYETDDDGRPVAALFLRQEPMGDLDRSYTASIVCMPVDG